MDLSEWFSTHLNASVDGFVWAVEQVPIERRLVSPPATLGKWSAARHVFHMFYYEQMVALPSMRQWLGMPFTLTEEDYQEDIAWGNSKDLESLLADFRQVRAEQIVLLPQFNESTWNETRKAVWGNVTLKWVVTKTFQHTAEHTHNILSMALFWDMHARHQQEQANKKRPG